MTSHVGSRGQILVVACFAAAIAALGGCSQVAESPPVAEEADALVSELPPCASPLMRRIYDRAKGLAHRGTVPEEVFATGKNWIDPEVLVDGPKIFPKMADLIASAESEILFQTYTWDEESVAVATLMSGLGRLQARLQVEGREGKAPVVARFVIDASELGVPSPKTSDIMPRVAAALEAQHLDPSLVTWEIAAFEHTTVGNNHSKTLVIDGREAVATGANPELVHNPGEPWHDTGYHVIGDVAHALMGDFDYAWNRAVAWTCGSNRKGSDCEHHTKPFAHAALAASLAGDVCAPVLVIGRKRNANPANNRTDNTQDQAFLAAFAGAARTIRIETPNLNDDAAKNAIVEAIERGVIVELISSKQFNEKAESVPGQGGGNEKNVKELYDRLRKHGVADVCQKLRARWYSFDGRAPVVGNGPRANHTKYATLDGMVAIVGSTNMDTQSWNNAHEADLVVDDARVVHAWDAQVFEPDFARGIVVDSCSAER